MQHFHLKKYQANIQVRWTRNTNFKAEEPGVVAHTCYTRTGQAVKEDRLPWVQGQPGQYSEFWLSLDYQMWPCLFFFPKKKAIPCIGKYPSEHWMVTVQKWWKPFYSKKHYPKQNKNKKQSRDQSHRLDSTVSSVDDISQIVYWDDRWQFPKWAILQC